VLRPETDYLAFLQQGRFMLLRSKTSGAFIFYPRVIEPGTGSTELEWVEASGLGTVYATTVVRKKIPSDNYNVALINLAEGPRMMSRVEGMSPDQVRIGLRVRARVVQGEEQAFVVFEPDENIDVTVKGSPA
jgi:uncharacterized OB-fold protein